MEPITKMMNQFIEMQQKTQSFWTDAFSAQGKITEDYLSILENSIEFHKAAVDYHNSIVNMMESIKKTQEILSKKK